MTNNASDEEIEESAESLMFNDALLNGDEKLNRLVKLVDTRFKSEARRTNKLRQEVRDNNSSLRRDLAPVILASKVFPAIGGFGSLVTLIYVMHSIGAF